MQKKILLICNDGNNVINFRKDLINEFIKSNYVVSIIVSNHAREDEIKSLGVEYYCVPFVNRSTNIFAILKLRKSLKKTIKVIKPDIVFTFQAKPNIVGVSASHSCGVKDIFSMVEGVGEPFQPKSLLGLIKRSLITKMYRKSFKHSSLVFFLNIEDQNEFISRSIIDKKKTVLINGIGINTKLFTPRYNVQDKKICFLARLIYNKGIFDYCDIAHEVRKNRPDIIFELYGEETDQIKVKDIQSYIDDNSIMYGGYVKNAREKLAQSRLLLFPSFYREGMPMTILEAMALGKPVISTNTNGAKDLVIDGKTGFVVNCRDKEGFVKKILEIIDDDELVTKFGMCARKICEEKYDSKIINEIVINKIKENCR